MASLEEATAELREIMNWVAVFETEYNLPKEVVDQLKQKLEAVVEKLANIE